MCGTTTGVLRERYQDVVLVFMHPLSAGYELERWYELQEFFCQHLLGKVFKEHTRARLHVENVHTQTISRRQTIGAVEGVPLPWKRDVPLVSLPVKDRHNNSRISK